MVAHTMLAALDNNRNTMLEQVEGENSKSSWKLQWSQHSQTSIVKSNVSQKTPHKHLMSCTWIHLNFGLKGKVLTILQPWCKSAVLQAKKQDKTLNPTQPFLQ